jgi:hypothetical protein
MPHYQRCRDCKSRVRDLLAELYGDVVVNCDLDLSASLSSYRGDALYDSLQGVYSALQRYRGHSVFVRRKKLAPVDFFIPKEGIIVEFDESQHFTAPREISLRNYPKDQKFGFSVERWCCLCRSLCKQDNDPIFRDEQRAWYDTVRDFAPTFFGRGLTIRLYAGDLQWCSLRPRQTSDLEIFRQALHSERISGAHDKRANLGH